MDYNDELEQIAEDFLGKEKCEELESEATFLWENFIGDAAVAILSMATSGITDPELVMISMFMLGAKTYRKFMIDHGVDVLEIEKGS